MLALSFSGFNRTETSSLSASETGWVPFVPSLAGRKVLGLGIAQGEFSGG
jgi:hypothetical protein